MPKTMERRLKQSAKRRGFGAKRTNAYVYGTLAKVKKAKKK